MRFLKQAWNNVANVARNISVRTALLGGISAFSTYNVGAAQAAAPATGPMLAAAPRQAVSQDTAASRIQTVQVRGVSYQQFTRASGMVVHVPENQQWRDVFEVRTLPNGREIRVLLPQALAATVRAELQQTIVQALAVPDAPPAPVDLSQPGSVLLTPVAREAQDLAAALQAPRPAPQTQRPRATVARAPQPQAVATVTRTIEMPSGTSYQIQTTGMRVRFFRVEAGRNVLLTTDRAENRAEIAEVRAQAQVTAVPAPAPLQTQARVAETTTTVIQAPQPTAARPAWEGRADPLQPGAQPANADEANPIVHTIYTAGNWQRLSNDPNAQNQLSLHALLRAERDTGVVFCKVRESDGTWYSNLIACPQDRLVNRILNRSRGLMMPGLFNVFNAFAYAMSAGREDLSEARQTALRTAHHAVLTEAQQGRVLAVQDQVEINRTALRQTAAAFVASQNGTSGTATAMDTAQTARTISENMARIRENLIAQRAAAALAAAATPAPQPAVADAVVPVRATVDDRITIPPRPQLPQARRALQPV